MPEVEDTASVGNCLEIRNKNRSRKFDEIIESTNQKFTYRDKMAGIWTVGVGRCVWYSGFRVVLQMIRGFIWTEA